MIDNVKKSKILPEDFEAAISWISGDFYALSVYFPDVTPLEVNLNFVSK